MSEPAQVTMNLYLCTYDNPDDDQSAGSNDVFVQAASPQQAFEIFVENWRSCELEGMLDDEEDADAVREAFQTPMTLDPQSNDHIRVFEILLVPSRSQAGILPWVHGLPARYAPTNMPGVALLRGYWSR